MSPYKWDNSGKYKLNDKVKVTTTSQAGANPNVQHTNLLLYLLQIWIADICQNCCIFTLAATLIK